jgi:hypothetical protein
MAAPSVTYAPSNGEVNDVTKINQNFTDIINGITDGTKDLTINKLTTTTGITCGGALTVGGDLYTVARTDYSGSTTLTGWGSTSVKKYYYRKIGKLVFVDFAIEGLSTSAVATFTLPATANTYSCQGTMISTCDQTTYNVGVVVVTGATATFYPDYRGSGWTSAATAVKNIWGQFFYETL